MLQLTTKAQQRALTRGALMQVARAEFAENGYADAGTNAVVDKANVTRGALYYHFKDKRALFAAVYEEEQEKLRSQVNWAVAQERDPGKALTGAIDAYLSAMMEPGARRIMMVDAPVVLGWERWREIDGAYTLGLLRDSLKAAADAGLIKLPDLDLAAKILSAAMNEAVFLIVDSDEPKATRKAARKTLRRMIDGLRPKG